MKPKLNPALPIMIVDDEEGILLAIDTTLQLAGFNNITTVNDSRQVMSILAEQSMEVLLLDLSMPHVDGEDLLALISREYPEIPIIIVTGSVNVETAVRCMKSGAFDYVIKPVDEAQLITAINRAMSFRDLKRENLALKQRILTKTLEKPEVFGKIITKNKNMLSIFQYIESIAHTSQPVLVRGETGVGKELIARAIHDLSGLTGQFVAVNVAGLDDNVFSDTLFGHVKGAFTGADADRRGLVEQAAGGTLFLDEIGDINMQSQVKLLRLLQEKEYFPLGSDNPRKASVRIVASTNRDLRTLQAEDRFRKDLNYRLRTHRIYIPPLRERLDDIELLINHFVDCACRDLNRKKPEIPEELVFVLRSYDYPGNIRELQAMIFDAISRCKSDVLSLDVFETHIEREKKAGRIHDEFLEGDTSVQFSDSLPTLKEAAQLLIEEAMKRADGNQSIAAKLLGISQQALSKRLKNMES